MDKRGSDFMKFCTNPKNIINNRYMENCDYKKQSNDPCEDCPKVITALHMCDLLQEIKREQDEK